MTPSTPPPLITSHDFITCSVSWTWFTPKGYLTDCMQAISNENIYYTEQKYSEGCVVIGRACCPTLLDCLFLSAAIHQNQVFIENWQDAHSVVQLPRGFDCELMGMSCFRQSMVQTTFVHVNDRRVCCQFHGAIHKPLLGSIMFPLSKKCFRTTFICPIKSHTDIRAEMKSTWFYAL